MIAAVKDKPFVRRFALILCLLVVFLAALAVPASALLFAFLFPTRFFFAAVIIFSAPAFDERYDIQLFPLFPVFSPRPPPVC
jgi:hypothetical protein